MLKRRFGLGGGGGVLGSGRPSQGSFGFGGQLSQGVSRFKSLSGARGGMFGGSPSGLGVPAGNSATTGAGGSLFYDEAGEEARSTLGGGGGYSEEELGGLERARGKSGPGLPFGKHIFNQEGTFVRDRKTGEIRRATVDDPLIDIMGVGGARGMNLDEETAGGGLFNQLLRNEFEVDRSIYADRTAEAARKFGLGRGSTQSGSGGGVFTPRPEGDSPFDFTSKGSVINPDYDFKAAGIDLMAGAQWRSREDIENFISALRKLPGLASKKSEKADTERDKIRKLVSGRRATTQTRRERIRGLDKEDEVLLGKL